MTTKTKTETKERKLPSAFPTFEKNTITLGSVPLAIRNDCKLGMWKIGDDRRIGEELEFAIIGLKHFWGQLGKSTTNWIQVWLIAAPNEKKIPNNLVCVTYVKTAGLRNLGIESQLATANQIGEGVDCNQGIWKGFFKLQRGDQGDYYSLEFSLRKRTDEEDPQLDQISYFLDSFDPTIFIDTSLGEFMVEVCEQMPLEDAKALVAYRLAERARDRQGQNQGIAQGQMVYTGQPQPMTAEQFRR